MFTQNSPAVNHHSFGRIDTPAKNQAGASHVAGPGTNKGYSNLPFIFAYNPEGVHQSGQGDRRRTLGVIVPNRDFGFSPQRIQDAETFWLGNIFQIDPAKRGLQQQYRFDEIVGIFGIQADGEAINSTQKFVKQHLAFHHRDGGLGTNVAQAQNSGSIADNGHAIPLVGVVVYSLRVGLNVAAGRSYAWRIPNGKIIDVTHTTL